LIDEVELQEEEGAGGNSLEVTLARKRQIPAVTFSLPCRGCFNDLSLCAFVFVFFYTFSIFLVPSFVLVSYSWV